jgi:predicted permease
VKGANVTLDWRVLAFTVLAALITGLLFGLIPALQAAPSDLSSSLKESGGRGGSGFRLNKARSILVISEVSLALLLLIGAALFIRTLIALRSVNPGFHPHNVVTTRTPLDPRFAKTTGVDQLVRDIFRRLNALPGVETAAFTRMLPLEGISNSIPMIVVGRPLNGPSHGSSRWMVVSPGYFDVLKIPLIRGRLFSDRDRQETPGVAIINQAMARRFWPAGDPLSDQLLIGKGLGPTFEEPARQVIGIVGDVHDDALYRKPQPAVFVPAAQLPDARTAGRAVAWIVRTRGPSRSLDSAIQAELRQATGGLPVPPVRSMEEIIVQSTARQDFSMLLMCVFGGSALLLAAIGIYGLLSYSVEQRTQELGIRLALGAESSAVRNMVVFQGMRLALAGVAIGIAAAFGLTRFIATLLFGIEAWDPMVFITVPVFLSVVALFAVWLPARRASRINPIDALRHE